MNFYDRRKKSLNSEANAEDHSPQANPPDVFHSLPDLEHPPGGLPTEMWAHVLSFLSDYDLLRSVIPLNRFFRNLAYNVGFKVIQIKNLSALSCSCVGIVGLLVYADLTKFVCFNF